MEILETKIEKLPKIGTLIAKRLEKIGISTLGDLLFYFPRKYEDFSKISKIREVKVGEKYCLKGKIIEIKNKKTWQRKINLTIAIVSDKTASLKVIWFNRPYLTNIIKKGDIVYLAGKIKLSRQSIFLENPIYEKLNNSELIHTGRLVPFYPETEKINSRFLRSLIKSSLNNFSKKIKEYLPKYILEKNKLLEIKRALWQIHFPDSKDLLKKAKERFAFEELLVIQLAVLREKIRIIRENSIPIPINLKLIKDFLEKLPFELTKAQKKCLWQILKDIEKKRPMNRLLEGDVGSGKTIVAIIVSLNVVKAGFQVTLMAPTEILAKQHFKEFTRLLNKYKVRIGLLSSKEDKVSSIKLENRILEISREKLLEDTKNGKIDILIGTHALIQKNVKFKKLALVIIDEQHRFGVKQRAKLISRDKNENKKIFLPHFLSITATPIPRTLALTLYGDLDLSIIDELPKGRKKIITKIVSPKERKKVYDFIRERIKNGERAFVICPRIEKNEKTEMKSVKEEAKILSEKIFPEFKVGYLHGKMKVKEKERVMENFKNGKIDILVSTSVVEVGINIKKATIMLIEGAERFGLAQLYQFKGRVGRSDLQSFCFLFCNSRSKKVKERLSAILKAKNGFELAQKDLEIRGPGQFLGEQQWGIPDLAMEKIKDIKLVEKTRKSAYMILEEDFSLEKYPYLLKMTKGLEKNIHLE